MLLSAPWYLSVHFMVICAAPMPAAPTGTALPPQIAAQATLLNAQQDVFRTAAARVAPCIVTIETVGGSQPVELVPGTTRPAGAGFIVADGPTTGLIYSADGLILTSAFNFVRDPSLITVVLPDRRRFVAEMLARDEVRQLAMVKIEAKDLPTPRWVTDPSQMRVGQWAIALGRGFGGAEPSMTVGIISGMNRQSGLAIQTDARLSPANFGGPVLDIEGRVLGLAVPMGLTSGIMAGVELYDSGIGFAIPYTQSHQSAESLSIGHNLRRGMLGVNLGGKTGLTIMGLADPSPAARAGLQKGDRLVAVDGRPLKKYQELQRMMRGRLAGQRISLTVLREGKRMEVPLVLAVPEDLGKMSRDQDELKPDRPATRASPQSPEPPRRDQE